MKSPVTGFNKAFESKARLGIMSVLMVNDAVDFNHLKTLLELTDGNLASHISALEKLEYIQVEKIFMGKKPKTSFTATPLGREAFQQHLTAIEQLLDQYKIKR